MSEDAPKRHPSFGDDPPVHSEVQLELLRIAMERGLSVRMRAHGSSMTPMIRDGDVVTIVPIGGREPRVGEVVACVLPVSEKLVLHRVVARRPGGWLLRGDNSRENDGAVAGEAIVGSVARVERDGRDVRVGVGSSGAVIARLSRSGVLRILGMPRRLFYRALSSLRQGVQSLALYRLVGRRLGARVSIEEASEADAREASDFFGNTEAGLPPHGSPNTEVTGWVAKLRGKIIGFAEASTGDDPASLWSGPWLRALWVKGRYRGLGVGEALTSRAIRNAAARGATQLSVAVFEDNASAVSLFRKLGFADTTVEALEAGFSAEKQLLGRRRIVLSGPTRPSWVDESRLSPETRALLVCARAVLDPRRAGDMRAALAACSDGDRLCQTAAEHGMVGHLHRSVAGQRKVPVPEPAGGQVATAAPPAFLARLGDLQRSTAERSLRQTAQLLWLIEKLEAAGVEAMPYKGPAWGERFYGDLTLRAWSDLDLLVAHAQMARAREVVLANGFTDSSPFNERIMAKRDHGLGEIAFWAAGTDVHLELHWEATVGAGARSLRAEAILEQAGRLHLLGREVATPSDVDALLISCLNGTKDRWASVEGLLCAALQARELRPAGWPALMSRAREAGGLRRTIVAVTHVCRVFGMETPAEVAAAVARDAAARRLLRSLGPETLERGRSADTEPRLDMLTWRFSTEDSLAAGLTHAATRFFRPGPEDWEWFALPRGARWLYRVLRPARLAAKWAKRL